MFPRNVGFRCSNCGACCRVQPPDVNPVERRLIEGQGFKDFLDRTDEMGIRWVRRQKDGSCHFFTKDNKCAIYEVRPAICRLEPFTIVDFDYGRNKIELELNYPFSCCCEGVFEGETLHIEEMAKAAWAIVQKILAVTARDLRLPENDAKVFSEVRSRILRRCVELADLRI